MAAVISQHATEKGNKNTVVKTAGRLTFESDLEGKDALLEKQRSGDPADYAARTTDRDLDADLRSFRALRRRQ
jgi:hypothetical protein